MADITSAQSGNWHDASTWTGGVVPGDGDTATIETGHTVTIAAGNPVTVGAAGITGTAAVTVKGTLVIEADLTLKGDLVHEPGSVVQAHAPAAGGLVILFDPPSGAAYQWRRGTAGDAYTLELVGQAGSPVTVTTSATGISNGDYAAISVLGAIVDFEEVRLVALGPTGVPGFHVLLDAGTSLAWNRVRAINCRRMSIETTATNATVEIDRLDIRACREVVVLDLFHNSGLVPPTPRTIRRLTVVGAPDPSLDTQVSRVAVAGPGAWVFEDPVLIDARIQEGVTSNGMIVRRLFGIADIPNVASGAPIVELQVNSAALIEQSAFLEIAGDPKGITDDAGTSNVGPLVVQDCVFDGNDHLAGVSLSRGDCIDVSSVVTIQRCLNLRAFGTLCGEHDNAGRFTVLHNTCYGSGPANFGYRGGSPDMLVAFRGNLFVNQAAGLEPFSEADGGTSTEDLMRQNGLEWDYNAFFGLTAPDRIEGGPIRMSNVEQAVASCTAGTDEETVVASGADFVNDGVQAGDYVRHSTKGFARIVSVDGATQLTLAAPGIPGLTSGDAVTVYRSWWATPGKHYGEDGAGLHDLKDVDPQFRDPTRSLVSWDAANGGPGTLDSLKAEVVKLNGCDLAGTDAVFNPAYTITAALAYLREGFTPLNPVLRGAGSPTDGSLDIGAVPVATPGPMVGGRLTRSALVGGRLIA